MLIVGLFTILTGPRNHTKETIRLDYTKETIRLDRALVPRGAGGQVRFLNGTLPAGGQVRFLNGTLPVGRQVCFLNEQLKNAQVHFLNGTFGERTGHFTSY